MAKRGRPPGKIQSEILHKRTTPQFLRAVDKWRRQQDEKPSRSDAIRRLVELGLKAKK